MYKRNSSIIQNTYANALIIGANSNPINKKVRLDAVFSINYKKQYYYLLIYRKTLMFARKIHPLPAK